MSRSSEMFCTGSSQLENMESNETASSFSNSMLNSLNGEETSDYETEDAYIEYKNDSKDSNQISTIMILKKPLKPDESDNVGRKRRKILVEKTRLGASKVRMQSLSTEPCTSIDKSPVDCPEVSEDEESDAKALSPSTKDEESDAKALSPSTKGTSKMLEMVFKYFAPMLAVVEESEKSEDLNLETEESEKSEDLNFDSEDEESDAKALSPSTKVKESDAKASSPSTKDEESNDEASSIESLDEESNDEASSKESLEYLSKVFVELKNTCKLVSDTQIDYMAEFERFAPTESAHKTEDFITRKHFISTLHILRKRCANSENLKLNILDHRIRCKIEYLLILMFRLGKRKAHFNKEGSLIAYLILPVIKPIVLTIELSLKQLHSRVDLLEKKSALKFLVEYFGDLQVKGRNLSYFLKKPFDYCNHHLDRVLISRRVISLADFDRHIYNSDMPDDHVWWFHKRYLHDIERR